ncbi:hypothetical protein [Mesonia maritima]|uniref:Uncharacterized protein n=1 Tax=Mesonia maritima TaxID=1793873 RepID=A0ABU1K9X5_9FLAO|nr:hypothetical protein [Mesonia maritima]MDR6301842.1 hypothetical protein [Mesonia maritima]
MKNDEQLLVKRNNYSFHRKSKNLMTWMSEIIKNKHYYRMGGEAA